MMMNYFDWFDLEISLAVDQKKLKKLFLFKSREFHPDFHTLMDQSAQSDALEKATYNNEAYKHLRDFDTRLKYVLELHDVSLDASNNKLEASFLMEMMEINESIMDLQFDFSETVNKNILDQVDQMERSNLESIESIVQSYDYDAITPEELGFLKVYYFKHRYLLRIKENLDKLAAQ